MLQIPLKNIISLSEARKKFSKLIDAAIDKDSFLITKGGRPAVIITSVELIQDLYRQGIIATDIESTGKSKEKGTDKKSGGAGWREALNAKISKQFEDEPH